MKDAEDEEIISGKLYRNFGATALDFNSAYSKIYLVRQLPSGLIVAKDEKGVSRRVWSHEEISEMYDKKQDVCMKKVRANELYQCNKNDILIMQENLERSRNRTPGLISLLNDVSLDKSSDVDQEPCFLEVFVMNDPTSGNPVPIVRPVKEQSQPKCTTNQEIQFPFPHIDPNSPGYNPYKKGGDNPNPYIHY